MICWNISTYLTVRLSNIIWNWYEHDVYCAGDHNFLLNSIRNRYMDKTYQCKNTRTFATEWCWLASSSFSGASSVTGEANPCLLETGSIAKPSWMLECRMPYHLEIVIQTQCHRMKCNLHLSGHVMCTIMLLAQLEKCKWEICQKEWEKGRHFELWNILHVMLVLVDL